MPSSLLEYIHFTINHRDHTIKLFAALFLLCYRLEVTQHSMTWLHSLDGRWGKSRDKQKATRELLHCRQKECGLLSKPSLWKWCYSKEKSHTDVQFRSRAVKQWHALAGLSKPIITWHSEYFGQPCLYLEQEDVCVHGMWCRKNHTNPKLSSDFGKAT